MHLAHFASPDKVVSLSLASALLVLAANIRAATLVMIANVRFIDLFPFVMGLYVTGDPLLTFLGRQTFNPNRHLCKSRFCPASQSRSGQLGQKLLNPLIPSPILGGNGKCLTTNTFIFIRLEMINI